VRAAKGLELLETSFCTHIQRASGTKSTPSAHTRSEQPSNQPCSLPPAPRVKKAAGQEAAGRERFASTGGGYHSPNCLAACCISSIHPASEKHLLLAAVAAHVVLAIVLSAAESRGTSPVLALISARWRARAPTKRRLPFSAWSDVNPDLCLFIYSHSHCSAALVCCWLLLSPAIEYSRFGLLCAVKWMLFVKTNFQSAHALFFSCVSHFYIEICYIVALCHWVFTRLWVLRQDKLLDFVTLPYNIYAQ